ncbi:RNA polymerase sigma factor [Streptomyces sp. NPDC059349]|uniref:RNA polymerase sigma factor n=1 Tax=Streptomyces sp. NPDC059349 TaxID=3346808 RepID=UPI00369F1C17
MTDPFEQGRDLIEPAELPDDFESFFARHEKEFLKAAASRVRDFHDAQDVVLEAGAKIYRKWPRVKAHANPIALAHRILNIEVANFYRRRARIDGKETPYGELSYADLPTGDDLLLLGEHEELDQALAQLEERAPVSAACVRLRFLAELSYGEVAAALDITYGSAKTNVCKGLKHLHTLMDLPNRGKGDS